jgi:hypothetical protein
MEIVVDAEEVHEQSPLPYLIAAGTTIPGSKTRSITTELGYLSHRISGRSIRTCGVRASLWVGQTSMLAGARNVGNRPRAANRMGTANSVTSGGLSFLLGEYFTSYRHLGGSHASPFLAPADRLSRSDRGSDPPHGFGCPARRGKRVACRSASIDTLELRGAARLVVRERRREPAAGHRRHDRCRCERGRIQ